MSVVMVGVVTLIVVRVATYDDRTSDLSSSSGRPGPEEAARVDIQRRLNWFVPPPGAEEVDGVLQLPGPPSEPVTPNYLDASRAWVTPESTAEVDAWLKAHPPHRSRLIEYGSGSGSSDRGYVWGDLAGTANERWLKVSFAANGEGTALRADSQAVWIEPRPKGEELPADARFLEVRRTRVNGETERMTVRGVDVQRLANLIDGFGIVQPGETSCTEPGPQSLIWLSFRREPDGGEAASARFPWPMSNCDNLKMTIGGRREPALEEAWILYRRLQPIFDQMAKRARETR
jgi:hypothetical protein